MTIRVNPIVMSVIYINIPSDTPSIYHDFNVIATGPNAYEYNLNGSLWQHDNRFTDMASSEHEISIRDINGFGENNEIVALLGYPRYFTSNNDGYHDTSNIYG